MQVSSLHILRTIARTTSTISLKDAVRYANVGVVPLLLLEQTVDDDDFVFACTHEHTDIVRLLLELPLERGVNPAANYNQALRVASQNGHLAIVRLLLDLPLDRGVNSAADENFALQTASFHGHTEIVRLLPWIRDVSRLPMFPV